MAEPKPTNPPASAFSPEQEARLQELIAAAVKSPAPPPGPANNPEPKVADDEWGKMSMHDRESWVEKRVGWVIDQLAAEDANAERDRRIAELEKEKGERERNPDIKPPSVIERIQRALWGSEPAA